MTVFPETLESDRLRYEVARPDAIDPYELYEYANVDAPHIDEITEHVTWDPYDHPKVALDWLNHCASAFDDGEEAHNVIRPTHGDRAGELAGMAGIVADWDRQLAEFGTWLRKPFWGRGYSGERAEVMLELAFDRLDLDLVAVSHATENEPSRRAIEKYVERYGGHREGELRHGMVIGGEPRDIVRYSISQDEWRANG